MRIKNYWERILLFLVWLIAAFPLFRTRFIPTHDGEYHLIRIFEFFKMLQAGNLIPRWAPGLNSEYGFPLFIFHYPFPNYVGSLFHFFGFSLVQSFQMSLALGMLVCGTGCYVFLKKEFQEKFSPLLGTILFLTIPYLYVDTYIRGSIGEIWAIAWMFVAVASMVWGRTLLLAVSIGLLIISHNIMAMIMLPILFGYAWFFYRRTLVSMVIGILLASYFWIPALMERQYVVGLNSVTYSDHFPELIQLLFPSWGSNFSQPGLATNEMSQQIGVVALFVLIITSIKFVFYLLTQIVQEKSRSPSTSLRVNKLLAGREWRKPLYFFIVTLIALFLMFSFSDPVWKTFSFLQYIQYPWRLLSVLLVTIPLLGAAVFKNTRAVVQFGIIVIAFFLSFSYMQPVTYEPRSDEYYLTKREFTDGTSSLGNSFSTVWTPWKQERSARVVTIDEGNGTITSSSREYLRATADITAETDLTVSIHTLYYPGWSVWDNGKELPILYEKEGILTIQLSAGQHHLEAEFRETPTRLIANLISVGTIIILLRIVIRSKPPPTPPLKRRRE